MVCALDLGLEEKDRQGTYNVTWRHNPATFVAAGN
jgi:hypothetical protein